VRWRALVCACSRAGAVGTGLAVVTRRSRARWWHGTCRDAARVGRERPAGATPSPPLHPKGEKWSLSFQVYSPLYAKCGLVYHVHMAMNWSDWEMSLRRYYGQAEATLFAEFWSCVRSARAAQSKKDPEFPGVCPRCGGAAYVGVTTVDCREKCQ